MTHQRQLVLVSPTFHPEPIGTPVYATDVARWFSEHGWGVRVITAQPFYPAFERYAGYGRATRRDRLHGIEILRVPTIVPRQGKAAWRAVNELNFALQGFLRAPGRRSDAVLTITPGVPWAALVGRALRRDGGRHVVLVHDIQSGLARALHMGSGRLGAVMKASERLSLQRADRIAVLTEEMGEAVAALGVDRPIEVAPLWTTVSPPAGFETMTEASVQYSGNFGQKQGVDLLIDLADALGADGPAMVLRGSGGRFDAIRDGAASKGLDRISFEAPVAAEDLPLALAKSPVHVVMQAPGSSQFAMPSKVVNALACGCHVVAMADVESPLRRLATDVDGLELVDVGAVADMASRISSILGRSDLAARRKQIAASAARHFSRDRWMEHLAGFLERGSEGTRPGE